jgi:hypothetical protein
MSIDVRVHDHLHEGCGYTEEKKWCARVCVREASS